MIFMVQESLLFFKPTAMHWAALPDVRMPLKALGAIMTRISNVKKILEKCGTVAGLHPELPGTSTRIVEGWISEGLHPMNS
jgi:hypothetical protein